MEDDVLDGYVRRSQDVTPASRGGARRRPSLPYRRPASTQSPPRRTISAPPATKCKTRRVSIERVYIHLMSNEWEPEAFTKELGFEPTSSRNWVKEPGRTVAKHRFVYSWEYASASDSTDLPDRIRPLEPVLVALARADLPSDTERSLVVYGFSKGQGYVFIIEPGQHRLIADAGCQTYMDIWSPLQGAVD